MGFFDYMFDYQGRMRTGAGSYMEYRHEQYQEQVMDDLSRDQAALAKRVGQGIRESHERVDQLELMVKALVELVLAKGIATRDEMSVLMQQLDLLDGVEDGRLGKETHADAPSCASCGRYVNPQRPKCVYCGGEVVVEAKKEAPRPRPTVTCAGCGSEVPEDQTFFTENGLRCEICFTRSG
jgi:hypothetical protein